MPILRAAEPLPRRPSAQLRSHRWPRRLATILPRSEPLTACATPGGSALQATRRVRRYVARERVVAERDVHRVDRLRMREPQRGRREPREHGSATSPTRPTDASPEKRDRFLLLECRRVGRVGDVAIVIGEIGKPALRPAPTHPLASTDDENRHGSAHASAHLPSPDLLSSRKTELRGLDVGDPIFLHGSRGLHVTDQPRRAQPIPRREIVDILASVTDPAKYN